jgi:DNA-binding CsgD family transcriptional regulator
MFQNLATTNEVDFTSREIQIIELIQQGLSSKEKANQLSLSEKTITRHRQNIALKAGTSGQISLRKYIKNYPPYIIKIIILIIVIIKIYGRKLVVYYHKKLISFKELYIKFASLGETRKTRGD